MKGKLQTDNVGVFSEADINIKNPFYKKEQLQKDKETYQESEHSVEAPKRMEQKTDDAEFLGNPFDSCI